MSMSDQATHYLLMSDIHLGADVAHRGQRIVAGASIPPSDPPVLDRNLAALLDRYRAEAEADSGRRWTLVIAGDVIDFVSMGVAPHEGESDPESVNEGKRRVKPAGDEVKQAVHKLRAVARRHELAFRALARFVAAGHRLVLVRGNHDLAFYWRPVRRAFVKALLERMDAAEESGSRAAFRSRIEFRDWFYYVEGQLYVEHGHLYDETCCYQNALAPLSPCDPARLMDSFSDILERYVVGPTRGLGTAGHENRTLFHYLWLAFSLGLSGFATLGIRFAGSIVRLLSAWRASLGRGAAAVRALHERRMKQLAGRFRLKEELLRSLASLWAVPVTRRLSSILRSLFLDVLLALGGLALVLACVMLFELTPLWLLLLLALPLVGVMVLWIRRRRVLDSAPALRKAARGVVALLPACFVVMGHTHVPEVERIGERTTYVNLGRFLSNTDGDGDNHGEGDGDSTATRASSRPPGYLVLRNVGGRLEADFGGLTLPDDRSVARESLDQ